MDKWQIPEPNITIITISCINYFSTPKHWNTLFTKAPKYSIFYQILPFSAFPKFHFRSLQRNDIFHQTFTTHNCVSFPNAIKPWRKRRKKPSTESNPKELKDKKNNFLLATKSFSILLLLKESPLSLNEITFPASFESQIEKVPTRQKEGKFQYGLMHTRWQISNSEAKQRRLYPPTVIHISFL